MILQRQPWRPDTAVCSISQFSFRALAQGWPRAWRCILALLGLLLLASCNRAPAQPPLALPAEILRVADDFSVRLETSADNGPVAVAYFDSQGRSRSTTFERFALTTGLANTNRDRTDSGPIVLDAKRAARQALGQVPLPTEQGVIQVKLVLYRGATELSARVDLTSLPRGGYALAPGSQQTNEREAPTAARTPAPTVRPLENTPPGLAMQAGDRRFEGVQSDYCWDIGCVSLNWITPVESAAIQRGATLTFTTSAAIAPTAVTLTVSEPRQRAPLAEFSLTPAISTSWAADLPAGSYTLIAKMTWGGRGATSRLFRVDVRDAAAAATARAQRYRLFVIGGDGNLWSTTNDGRQTQLTDLPIVTAISGEGVAGLSEFAVTADGMYVALAWFELAPAAVITAHLDLLDPNSGRRRPLDRLDNLPQADFGPASGQPTFAHLSWSQEPGAPRLTYARATGQVWHDGNTDTAVTHIWQVGVGQEFPEPLLNTPAETRDLHPTRLADDRLLFLRQARSENAPALWRLEKDGSVALLQRNVMAYDLAPANGRLAWLGLDTRPQPLNILGAPLALWIAPEMGAAGQIITELGWTLAGLRWNHTGDTLIFDGGRLADVSTVIWRWDTLEGLASVSNGPADSQPAWSLQDQGIVFSRRRDAGHYDLWQADLAGKNPIIIFTGGSHAWVAPVPAS